MYRAPGRPGHRALGAGSKLHLVLGLVLSLCAPTAGLAPSAHPAAGASGSASFGLVPSPHPAASTIGGTTARLAPLAVASGPLPDLAASTTDGPTAALAPPPDRAGRPAAGTGTPAPPAVPVTATRITDALAIPLIYTYPAHVSPVTHPPAPFGETCQPTPEVTVVAEPPVPAPPEPASPLPLPPSPVASTTGSTRPAAGTSGSASFSLVPSPHPAASTIDGTTTHHARRLHHAHGAHPHLPRPHAWRSQRRVRPCRRLPRA